MIDARLLVAGFERNTAIVRAQVDGLNHAESLLQTPYRLNCLNWVLGHLLEARGRILDRLGSPRMVPAAETARYRRESEPVLEDGPGVLRLEALIDGLEETQSRITDALSRLDEKALAVSTDRGDGTTAPLGEVIHFGLFHDTYHTGQTEMLRQVAGKGDKVI